MNKFEQHRAFALHATRKAVAFQQCHFVGQTMVDVNDPVNSGFGCFGAQEPDGEGVTSRVTCPALHPKLLLATVLAA